MSTTQEPEQQYIFRRFFRHPQTGQLMDAYKYGRKAWRIPVPADPS